MKKYTPEQLSRILSAAANCELGGVTYSPEYAKRPTLCIEQAATASYNGQWSYEKYVPYDKMIRAKKGYAKITRNPDNMLRWMEKHKMA